MSMANNNNQLKQNQRFWDGINEPLTVMTPIRGYDEMPIVSLEEAVRPLVSLVPEVGHMVFTAMDRAKRQQSSQLSQNESAAITLYTIEWQPRENSVYYILNNNLRSANRQSLKPWFFYLKLLLTALSRLPLRPGTVFRGMNGDTKQKYTTGDSIIWWGFTSCTSSIDALRNKQFLDSTGPRTFFTIECQSGRDIQQFSYFEDEKEVLLPPGRYFKVEGTLTQSDGFSMIQLKEIQPAYPLLESFSTIGQLVKQFAPTNFSSIQSQKSAQPTPYQPILNQPTNTLQSNFLTLTHVSCLATEN